MKQGQGSLSLTQKLAFLTRCTAEHLKLAGLRTQCILSGRPDVLSSQESVTTEDKAICTCWKKATISLIAAWRFLCLTLHKIWQCCTLQLMEEKDYKKAHSKTNQFEGKNNFPAVLKILINFLLNAAIRGQHLAIREKTISYLEM